jgi:hypothetical protein
LSWKNLPTRVAVAAAILVCGAHSSPAAVILNTFPEVQTGEGYAVFELLEWQSLAVPFKVPVDGRITRIETGVEVGGSPAPIAVGVVAAPLLGQSSWKVWDPLFAANVCGPIDPVVPHDCFYGLGDVYLDRGERAAFEVDLFLPKGDYYLYAHGTGDFSGAIWHAGHIQSDDWLVNTNVRGANADLAEWVTVGEVGPKIGAGDRVRPGGRYGVPAARIYFSVPEPTVIALLAVGLAVAMRRRRVRS